MKKKVPFSKVSFPVPPVCTAYWSTDDWIRYAQNHNPNIMVVPDNGGKHFRDYLRRVE